MGGYENPYSGQEYTEEYGDHQGADFQTQPGEFQVCFSFKVAYCVFLNTIPILLNFWYLYFDKNKNYIEFENGSILA